jgi:Secretion system C-terminal sorting domain
MKLKIYFSIIIILVLNANGFCQIDPLRKKLDSIFQYVDKTQIPTGYLKEYGSEFLPLHSFNGLLTDSNTVNSLDIFRTAYCDMVTAKLPVPIINPSARVTIYNTLLPLPQVNNQIDAVPNNGTSPIALLYTKYASLKETALTQNLFTVNNQQIYDVPNRTISPYNINNLFVAAAIKETFTNTVSLILDTAFFYRNMNVLITGAFVDFKDGQGYRTLSSNPIQKIYTDSSGRKPIIFKVTTNDGNTLYCNSSVLVTVTNNTASRYIDTDPQMANIEVPVVAADGIGGGDFMQIRYAKNNPTRLQSQQHVRKPLIYVEGYDATDINRSNPNNNGYNIYSLIRNNTNNPNDRGEWIKLAFPIGVGYDFMNDLDDIAGYDLVFVNYNTLRSFEDNTKMLQQVIKWVNADKILGTGGTATQNVVLGVSAGGVLARYTLARLTKFVGVNYADTRLLLTMDSPHQGANVPLALQHFLYDLGEQSILGNKLKDNDAGLKRFIALNNAPATAQLLKARVIDGNGTVVLNTFLNGPNSPYQLMVRFDINNPNNAVAPYKFLAVAQGSQCGVPVCAPGTSFASQNAEFAIFRFWFPANMWPPIYATSKWWLTSQLNALPNSGTSTIEYFKFERRIKFWGIGFGFKTINEYTRPNPAGYVSWDGAPGGTQSISDRTDGGLSSGLAPTTFTKNWYGFPYASLKAGASLNINQDAFSFVSTTSALDAPFGTDPNTVFNFAANGNANTATFKYQAQSKETGSTLYNRNHTDYTPRNARWIFNEMQNTPAAPTCSDFCDNQTINGADIFCTSNTYLVAGLPPGSTVTWSATPAGIVNFTPSVNSNPVTVNNVLGGSITLSANVSNSCTNLNTTITKNITVGSPPISISSSTNGCNGVYQIWNLVNNTPNNGTNWNWTVSYLGTNSQITIYTPSSPSTTLSVKGGGTVKLSYIDLCGTLRTSGVTVYSTCFSGPLRIAVSPNPASGNIKVSFNQQTDTALNAALNGQQLKPLHSFESTGKTIVTLYEFNTSLLVKQWTYKEMDSKNYNFNIAGLRKGLYLLQVDRDNQTTATKIIIE